MDNPICLSQYFVNKQNVRSFGNILKFNMLKSEGDVFYKHLLESDLLVSATSSDLFSTLSSLKTNLKNKSKGDFKCYFPNSSNTNFHSVHKEDIFNYCWIALNEIIPKSLFGSSQNTKVFRSLVRIVIYSMKGQHFLLTKYTEKWDFSVHPWKAIQNTASKNILHNILIWIFKYILSAMISLNFYVTTCKLDADEYKLYYFWKHQWQSFYDKKISNMIFTKVIKRFEPYCLGKKLKLTHNLNERLKLKTLKKEIPKLHLVLKANNDSRPIVRYKNNPQSSAEKYKIKERLNFLKVLIGKSGQKLETQFNSVYLEWLTLHKPKLYFVKTDLSNAFGSVNKEKLMKILSDRHLNLQKVEKNGNLKKKIAQQYKDMLMELQKPLLVRAGSTVFEWKKGLVQGYKYSPALSELYYTHMDEIYFCNHLKKTETKIKLFIRVVDDYLYITDSLEDAHSFLNALSNYRNVNYGKTVVNFVHDSIKSNEDITFLGYSYNTSNLQVSRASNVFVGQMCYKIAFTNALSDLNKFLENRIGQSGIQINGHIFNLTYNKEELIWNHIFTTFCLSANKFCTILAVLCDVKDINVYLTVYKKRVTVKLSNSLLETLMKNKPVDVLFVYCINHLHYLSWKALCFCAINTPKCSSLVPLINDELAKTNCLFGKWIEHASRISSNGEIHIPAIKEVCRRSDLRIIMKRFDSLPSGFECYNHRKIK